MSAVVLFGAGASYGTGGVLPAPPPLGSDLGQQLAETFPAGWGALPEQLRAQFDADFERGMGALWDSGSHAIAPLMQQMAMFFARYQLPQERTDAYSNLVRALLAAGKLNSTYFSSLNYDCLFELSVSPFEKVNYFAQTKTDSGVIVWKLHGSCNFLPAQGVTATRGVSFGPGVTFGTGIQPVDPTKVSAYCLSNTALYPVMAIYMRGKPVQVAPGIIEGTQEAWRSVVESTSVVVVIGARPHPPDTHIWKSLATTEAKLLFVGNERAFSSWESKHRTNRDSTYLGNRFDSCIEAVVDNL